jgi:hypothetical protein
MTMAQPSGLLDLAPDGDTEVLSELIAGNPGDDVVLSTATEAAYERYAARANGICHLGDPLHRWLY